MRIIPLLATSIVLIAGRRLITQEIVSVIKSRTKSWTPYEAHENPFRNKTDAEIQNIFGLLPPQEGIF